MMSEWKNINLGDVVEFNYGKALTAAQRINGNVPVYSSAGLTGWHNSALVDSKGIIIGRKGTIGKVYKSDIPFFTIDTAYYILANDKKYNFNYMYYLLSSLGLENLNEDSVVPGLNRNTAYAQKINFAPMSIQIKIAQILSALDNKIELNRKMNQTLEEMAQTLFKSWFVDFDPVHAKVNAGNDADYDEIAKELGISREVLDLFPDEFEESELGMIPKGWGTESLDNVAHYQNGLALQKYRPTNEKKFLPVLKIAQLKKGYADGEEKADPGIKPECIVDSGDVVFSWSGSLVVDIWCGGKVALNQHLFKVTSKEYSKWFYYYWTKQHLKNFQQIAADKAVTMGHIKRSHLAEAICVVPNAEVMNLAENIISPMLEKLISNRLESFTLQKTRDTLLPKLLSGELDISKLELDDVKD